MLLYKKKKKKSWASILLGSHRNMIHFGAWCSTTMVKWFLSKYGLHIRIATTTTDNTSRSVTEYFISVSEKFRPS